MFQDLADDNNLDDVMLDGDDFPVDDEDIEGLDVGGEPENLIRDEDNGDYDDEDDEDNPLFDTFEDRDLL